MTAPGQSLPDTVATLLGIQPYTNADGGGDKRYGQGVTEDYAHGLFTPPAIGIGNAVDVLRDELEKLPLEILQMFKPLIPDAVEDDFLEIATAVTKIIDAIIPRALPLSFSEFESWLSETFGVVSGELGQIFEIIMGLVVTPITSAVQAFKDWFIDQLLNNKAVKNIEATFGNIDFTADSFDPVAAIASFILDRLMPHGVLTSQTQVNPNQIAAIFSPTWDKNVLPDPNFSAYSHIDFGRSSWSWDKMGPGDAPTGAVRTRRTDRITVFWAPGTGCGTGAASTMTSALAGFGYGWLTGFDGFGADGVGLDPEYFDFVLVNYPALPWPMGDSINVGVDMLCDMIQKLPKGSKFILTGLSQGAHLISTVYDGLRYGKSVAGPVRDLRDRREDMLMGIAVGNPRRQQGRGTPLWGDVSTGGWGVYEPTLDNCEDKWWECAAPGDVACDVHDSESDFWTRELFHIFNQNHSTDLQAVLKLLFALPFELIPLITGAYAYYLGALAPGNPHDSYFTTTEDLAKPFIGDGDERTMLQIVMDYLNDTFGPANTAGPSSGEIHEMYGVPMVTEPGQIVRAAASTCWYNVIDCPGDAVELLVAAYDTDDNLIEFVEVAEGTGVAKVTDPDPNQYGPLAYDPVHYPATWDLTWPNAWYPLQGQYIMPADTAYARWVVRVYPDAARLGTVWASAADLEVPKYIDASILTNLDNIDQILAAKVGGMEGIQDMAATLQHMWDGMASAFNDGTALENIGLQDLMQLSQDVKNNASNAVNYAVLHEQILQNPNKQPLSNGLQPAGYSTFKLTEFPENTALPFTTIASGHTIMGFIQFDRTMKLGFIDILMKDAGGSNVYVNVYHNGSAGGKSNIYKSPDLSILAPDDWGWLNLLIPTAFQPTVVMGETYTFEIVSGSATISVASKTMLIPNHPTTPVPNYGATRVTASTGGIQPNNLTSGQTTAGQTQPFVCSGTAVVPADYHLPAMEEWRSAGEFEWPIPAWLKEGDPVDCMTCGAGAGAGGSNFVFTGQGGGPGRWSAGTLIYGVQIPLDADHLIVHVGQGGDGGPVGGYGQDGEATWIEVPGGDSYFVATGGIRGGPGTTHTPGNPNVHSSGMGAGNFAYNGQTMFGSATVADGVPGQSPGGGGGCLYGNGQRGGDGGARLYARQNDV